jgi:hypothetical protein
MCRSGWLSKLQHSCIAERERKAGLPYAVEERCELFVGIERDDGWRVERRLHRQRCCERRSHKSRFTTPKRFLNVPSDEASTSAFWCSCIVGRGARRQRYHNRDTEG